MRPIAQSFGDGIFNFGISLTLHTWYLGSNSIQCFFAYWSYWTTGFLNWRFMVISIDIQYLIDIFSILYIQVFPIIPNLARHSPGWCPQAMWQAHRQWSRGRPVSAAASGEWPVKIQWKNNKKGLGFFTWCLFNTLYARPLAINLDQIGWTCWNPTLGYDSKEHIL